MDCSEQDLPSCIRCMGEYMQEHQLQSAARKIDGVYIRQEGVAVVSAAIAWDAENETYGIPYEENSDPTWETEFSPVVKAHEEKEG